jgi:hypothetical protein
MNDLVTPEHLVLDSGALIQLERGDKRMIQLFQAIIAGRVTATIPRTVIAEVWRGGARQSRVAKLIKMAPADTPCRVAIDELTPARAKEIGKTIGSCGHDDIVDVNVALCARDPRTGRIDSVILTADQADILRVDNDLKQVIRSV